MLPNWKSWALLEVVVSVSKTIASVRIHTEVEFVVKEVKHKMSS